MKITLNRRVAAALALTAAGAGLIGWSVGDAQREPVTLETAAAVLLTTGGQAIGTDHAAAAGALVYGQPFVSAAGAGCRIWIRFPDASLWSAPPLAAIDADGHALRVESRAQRAACDTTTDSPAMDVKTAAEQNMPWIASDGHGGAVLAAGFGRGLGQDYRAWAVTPAVLATPGGAGVIPTGEQK